MTRELKRERERDRDIVLVAQTVPLGHHRHNPEPGHPQNIPTYLQTYRTIHQQAPYKGETKLLLMIYDVN